MANIHPKSDSYTTTAKLTIEEEEVIIQYILEFNSRGFLPKKAEV